MDALMAVLWLSRCKIACLLLMTVLYSGVYAISTGPQRLDEVQSTAEAFVVNQLKDMPFDYEVHVKPLDKRFRLKQCMKSDMKVSIPGDKKITNTHSVQVRCDGPAGWTVYLAIDLSLYTAVLVSTRPIFPGEEIRPSDVIVDKRYDVSKLHRSYFTMPAQAANMVARGQIPLNAPVGPTNTRPAIMVNRGDIVAVEAVVKGIRVLNKGVVMGKGSMGDRVLVETLSTKKVLEGEVTGKGVVRVKMN